MKILVFSLLFALSAIAGCNTAPQYEICTARFSTAAARAATGAVFTQELEGLWVHIRTERDEAHLVVRHRTPDGRVLATRAVAATPAGVWKTAFVRLPLENQVLSISVDLRDQSTEEEDAKGDFK